MAEKKRKVAITQLDEIWEKAKKQWGDPGLRHPPPDPRFESLRHLLNEIEEIFEGDRPEDYVGDDLFIGDSVSARKRPIKKTTKKKARRKLISDDEDDEDIPF